jgi:hypothetical protein
MSDNEEIQTFSAVELPPPEPPLPAMSHYTPSLETVDHYYAYVPRHPMIYTLPVSKPITTRYDYLIQISHQFKCPIDSLQMVLGPNLQVQIFYLACLSGDWPEMYHMIKEFGVDVNIPLSGELPALWFSAQRGNFEIVQNLLLLGADPNPRSQMTGLSAVDIANNNRFSRTAYLLRAYGGQSSSPRKK